MRSIAFSALAIFASVLALASGGQAAGLEGTWVRDDLDAATLEAQPAKEQILVVRKKGDKLAGKLVVPTLVGVPVTIEPQPGDTFRFTITMARGMETPLDGSLQEDQLGVSAVGPGGQRQSTMMRRASPEELAILERIEIKKIPTPAVKPLPPNGLARTPPMGWSSWNRFNVEIDDKTIREIADAMVKTGMRDAGYVYVNIDDGWQGTRDAQGKLQPNEKFPDMKALADYVHERGLKLGIYTSPGPKSCAGYEGSYGHEEQDAKTFAEWGVDYVKYDWCSAGLIYDDDEMPAVYQKMAEAMRATGRPMVYSICQYGRAEVWKWGGDAGGNLWRTTGDIADLWPIMASIGFSQADIASYSAPGRWNDPDMLEVGNGRMAPGEYRTHMSLWALLAAPLIAGHDVRTSSSETVQTLTNPEVIEIDQDPLGQPGKRVAQRGALEIWTKPMKDGRLAVGLFNLGEEPAEVTATFAELGLGESKRAMARDVWKRMGFAADGRVSATVDPHGVVLLVLTPEE